MKNLNNQVYLGYFMPNIRCFKIEISIIGSIYHWFPLTLKQEFLGTLESKEVPPFL